MVGGGMLAAVVGCTARAAEATPKRGDTTTDVCSLATNEEFQQAYGVNPQIGIIPDEPTATEMVWGPHCDYTAGSITLFTKKSPGAELDRVLAMSKADKQRVTVQGLGDRAFFTIIYPDDRHRRAGLLAVFVGPRIVTFTMDAHEDKPVDATRPRLESLAKLVLPRLQ
jgi:hypothetical protein